MNLHMLLDNFMHPPVLFFFLGLVAVWVKSDLEIPASTAKFFSLYLLLHIGFTGGSKLAAHGLDEKVIGIIVVCLLGSFLMPLLSFQVLRRKLDVHNAGAVAATYGSVSAVTFATGTTFLTTHDVPFGGYMVAGMALMESPAIISGLMCISLAAAKTQSSGEVASQKKGMKDILHEAFTNGSVFLLLGALAIGILTGETGKAQLKPFVEDIYKGFLTLYMLDMGLLAGRRLSELKDKGVFLVLFALIYPLIGALIGITAALLLGLDVGDGFLLTLLFASASYIAVPAALRMAVPEANMSIVLPMALGVTFTFNIALGIPLYFVLFQYFSR